MDLRKDGTDRSNRFATHLEHRVVWPVAGHKMHGVHRGRRTRMWVAAFSVMSLVLLGASPALATGEDPATVSAETVDPAAGSNEVVSEAPEEIPPPAPVVEEPPTPPTETPAPVPPVVPEEQPAPLETDSGAQGGTGGAGVELAAAEGATSPAPASLSASSVPEPPYLRWVVADEAGASVAATKVTVQGPRDDSVTDKKGEKQWLSGILATITDNTGEADYSGADLDPAPGAFLVKTLTADSDVTVTKDVAADEHYRVRPAEAAGWLVGDAAEWVAVDVAVAAETEATGVTLVAAAAAGAETETGAAQDEELTSDGGITPFVLGPETGVDSPFFYWELRRSSTNNALVGGGTFELQGPRSWGGNWNDTYTVIDCTAAPCTGYDQDPDFGEIQVPTGATGPNDTITFTTSQRWRMRPSETPSPWYFSNMWNTFTSSTSSWTSMNSSGEWSDGKKDFGDFYAAQTTPSTKSVTITVDKRTLRTGTGAGDTSAAGAAGVRFGMYDSETSTTAIATCQIQPSNLEKCIFPATALPQGMTVYVRELAPASGTDAAAKFNHPITMLNTSSGGNVPYHMTYLVPNSGSAQNVTLPGTDGTRAGYIANRADNPIVNLGCDAGARVAILMDTSGSVEGYENTLARAATALVDGLHDSQTPSSVAMFSFASSTPGAITNRSALQEVETVFGRNTVRGWYSTNNGQTANFDANGGTNWDVGLWATAQGGGTAPSKQYDVVVVLTDGNPTYSGNPRSGDGNTTTLRELERAVLSANAIKNFGTRIITVGIGGGLSDYNLSAVSGPTKYSSGDGLNEFDYITAGWDELENVMERFAKGLTCQATVTVEKQAKPYGGSYAAASGWEFNLEQTGADSVDPANAQSTGNDGRASWGLKFDQSTDTADITLSETDDRTGWTLAEVTCDGATPAIDLQTKAVTLTDVPIGANVLCTFKNDEQPPSGSISWQKVDGSAQSTHLAGSEWTVQGPFTGSTPGGATVQVIDCTVAPCAAADNDTDAREGYFKIEGLTLGNYRVTETKAPQGFTIPTPAYFDVTITAAALNADHGVVLNVRIPGTVIWGKSDGSGTRLNGSEWKLTGPGNTQIDVTDCTSGSCASSQDKDNRGGYFEVTGLTWGNWSLVETRAPAGYALDSTPHNFSITAAATTYTFSNTFVNVAVPGPTMPLTGGLGRDFFSLLGGGVLVLGFGAVALMQLRKRRREVA